MTQEMTSYAAAALAGFLLDFLFGDPHSMPHPVRALGSLIGWMEGWLRRIFPEGKRGELIGGSILAGGVVLVTGRPAFFLGRGESSSAGPSCATTFSLPDPCVTRV